MANNQFLRSIILFTSHTCHLRTPPDRTNSNNGAAAVAVAACDDHRFACSGGTDERSKQYLCKAPTLNWGQWWNRAGRQCNIASHARLFYAMSSSQIYKQ
ncbi:unnamed protein product [Ceratitis capitata]|uniref:(Mediterranean fruit fly) hypothetical protein n=1 Tax=Ceratitis capitata TaxID=7213 RepID=A0A811UJQ8_CERCA|nr:unnamed protein product [Ceratitis capitata]